MLKIATYIILLLILVNCQGLKKIPEGDQLYTGAKIKVKAPKSVRVDIEQLLLDDLLTPPPNTKIFGSRPFLWLHNRFKEPKKKKGFKYFMKYKLGKPPVLISQVRPEKVSQQISNTLYNEGYFKNSVNFNSQNKSKTGSINYEVKPGVQYTISDVSYPKEKVDIAHLGIIKNNSILKAGQNYSLERIEKERLRIEEVLKDSGYYYFDHSFIIFLADSTVGNNQVELIATLSKNTPEQAKLKYKIKDVTVLTASGLLNDNDTLNLTQNNESVEIEGITYYDPENKYKPKSILRFVEIEEGQTYNKIHYQQTVSQLLSLQNFTYVDMNFPEDAESGYLNAKLNLITKPAKSLRFEIQATSESNNFVGSSITTTFLNRNIFKGAEVFNLSLNTGFETQISGQQQNALNSYEISLKSSIKIPRLISPIGFKNIKNEFVPKTSIGIGVETIRRTNLYAFNSAELNIGYQWANSKTKSHQLYPVYIKTTQLTSTSDEFQSLLNNNPLLRESYEEQFIFGSKYSFYINTLADENNVGKRHNFYFDFSLELSGNILYLIQKGINSEVTNDNFQIFGSRYSQFLRTSVDFRHYLRFNRHHKIASRVILGLGSAYGNSQTLPVSRQFAIGGSSSIRAFRARSIGPGSFSDLTNEDGILIDQTADVKIEANFEYRHTLAGALQGAFFVDAGNIWTLNTDPVRPGSEFSSDRFIADMAMGTGYGLRYDASFFILRLDLAFPIRVPSETTSRWVIRDIAINKREWRRDNLVWNVALGFPF